MALTAEAVRNALQNVMDPELGKDLVSLEMIKEIGIDGGRIGLGVELTTPGCPMKDKIKGDIEQELKKLPGVRDVEINWTARVRATPKLAAAMPGVKNAIAIGAGKGGVGKSTISVLTAVGLARDGVKVGLLDADVYGPSIPKMVGLEFERPTVNGDRIVPLTAHGIKLMSVGFLVEPEKAVVWRGPMVHGLLQQFLRQVEWGELDYLIVDLPPGTGDVPLTLAQSLPMTGAVIVCTPQDVALLDAIKALKMFQQLNVDILGIVENMSYFRAPDTGKEYDLFGRGGARKAAEKTGVPFLGELPINISIRESGDAGTPTVNFEKTDEATRTAITTFVRNIAGQVSIRNSSGEPGLELKIT
ncbi:MAG: Mrp/NBP35 family ATP-binding protein [Planctomycetes bacterium]|nr:Mrp/NBP35 family ATP-binding protein [Planctomycetota bacterium]